MVGAWLGRAPTGVTVRLEILLVDLEIPALTEMPLTDTGCVIAVLTQERRYGKAIYGD